MDDHGTDFEADCNRKRNLDKRRETSRYAARDRRGKEADIFTDLKEVVPIVEEATVTHVDRIALLRVASTLCRLRKNAAKCLKTNLCEEKGRLWSEATLLESLDGFLAIIDADGVILYVTESVSIYLGLTQTDLTGRSLKEFVHTNDYEEFSKCGSEIGEEGRMMSMRMKSVISPRGRNLNLKSALFKPVICRIRSIAGDGGRVRLLQGSALPAGQGSSAAAAAKNAEVPNGTFMTRHTCDMKFSYVSESFNYILRHEARSLMGTSFYNLVHPSDINSVASSMREMLAKGHSRTPYYRLIGANNSVIWVQTEASTVNHTSKGHKGQYVICVHDLLGTQGESESFTIGRDTCVSSSIPVHVKEELDDTSDSKKGSYDEVLQWLFRDHPNSPAPNPTLFRAQNSQKRSVITTGSDESDPPLAKAALFGIETPESSVDDITYENSSNSPYTNNAGIEYSPLAAGVADCELRSSRGSIGSGRGGGSIDSGGGTNTTIVHAFGGDFPSDPLLNTDRVSTISPIDSYTLPNSEGIGNGTITRTDMYTALSSAGSQYTRTLGYDPYIHSPSSAIHNNNNNNNNNSRNSSQLNNANNVTTNVYKDRREDFFENPDLQMLAPFVAHEDMMQLTTDIHGLLPEFNFADWIPADPAPLPTTVGEQKLGSATNHSPISPVVSNPAHSSPTSLSSTTTSDGTSVSVSRQNSRSHVFAKGIPYPTPCVSPTSKGTPHFTFPNSGFTTTGAATPVAKRIASTTTPLSRNQCNGETFTAISTEPSQWIQQQYRVPSVQTSVLTGACTWTELGVRPPDSALTFRRDTPTVQQQRV